jgi:hypothetical protein
MSTEDFLLANPDADAPYHGEGPEDSSSTSTPTTRTSTALDKAWTVEDLDKALLPSTDGDPANEDDATSTDLAPTTQTSGLMWKVPVKGDDGAVAIHDVDEKELIAGYIRRADLTKRQTAIAREKAEIDQHIEAKAAEARDFFLEQAQFAHAAILDLAAIPNEAQLAQLAGTDPQAYHQEKARIAFVMARLDQIKRAFEARQVDAKKAAAAAKQAAQRRCWGVISAEGYDTPKLESLFKAIAKKYNIPAERFDNLDDPNLIFIMRDAMRFNTLAERRGDVTKKVTAAPNLPGARQRVPQNEARNRELSKRFRTGTANLRDLASTL